MNKEDENVDTKLSKRVGSSEGAEAAAIATVVLLSPALMFISAGMEAHAAEIRRNFAMKEFQQATVSPGDTMSGFVYFQLPQPSGAHPLIL